MNTGSNAHLQVELQHQHDEITRLRHALAAANALIAEGANQLATSSSQCAALRADLDAARRDVAVLREALTRLLSWRESDFDQPADIARNALAAIAVRTDALPGAPAAPNMAHLYARSNALTVAMQALEQIVKESERHGPAWPSHVARNALDHIGAPNAPGARTDALPPP